MITIEVAALTAMALVFVYSFFGSARSHSRSVAWAAPANLTPIYRSATQTGAITVIDAQDRFAARRALASAEQTTDLVAAAA